MAEGVKQYAMFVSDCPRCGRARTTFDILASTPVGKDGYGWDLFETFLRCRSCFRPSIGLLKEEANTDHAPTGFVGQYANVAYTLREWVFEVPGRRKPPAHVPPEVESIFNEAATCAAVGAWDASGTMFRKVLDAATRSLTPPPDSAAELRTPNWKTFKDLRLRLDWLFGNGLLNASLQDLSSCIHQDGNDAAHDLVGIGEEEAQDLGDFTERVLETIYTLPGQIAENKKRREQRRKITAPDA